MTKRAATMFMISDSYTMDDDDDEAVGSSSDRDVAANSSSSLPQQQQSSIHNNEELQTPKSSRTLPKGGESSSSPSNSSNFAEEKKSDSIDRPPSSSSSSSDADLIMEHDDDIIIKRQQQQQQSMEMKSTTTTMAMVKLRIWDPANATKQFKFITASKVLLLPSSQAASAAATNTSDAVDHGNNYSNSDEMNNKNFLRSNTSSSRREREHRLSIVKEERHGSSSTLDLDESTNNNAALDCYDEGMGEGQERRGTAKITNQSDLLQLSTAAANAVDSNNKVASLNGNQLLQVGDLVGIHLKKSTKSISSNSSTPQQQQHYQNQEWKVGHPIQLLHNLNLIPLHNNGLEVLLQRIEGNDPSLRELILDGITTTPIEVVTPTSPSPLHHHHQQSSLLSTSQLEILIEAIGTNTSIKKCSLRYSNITDEIASLIALCLVDNTTMTTLSLKGNDLTSSSAKKLLFSVTFLQYYITSIGFE